MTPGKLDELSAKPVASNAPRPIGADELVLGADHGSTTDRGKFGQWKRHSGRIPCLWTKAIEGSLRGWFITIGAQHCPSEFEINPCCSGLCIRLTQTPSHKQDSACRARHAIDRTRSGQCLGPRRTNTPNDEQVDEPRPTQQRRRPLNAPRAPHRRRTGRAPHKPRPRRSRSSPNRRRKADPLSRRHGLLVPRVESAAPSTTRRATNRAPTQTSSCAKGRSHCPFDVRKC